MSVIRLGVIGYGARARHMAQLMCCQATDVRLAAIADPRAEAIRREMREEGKEAEAIHFYESADEMLEQEPLEGVIVGTRCSLHATMALKVIARGLPLFLEKPVATNMADLLALRAADPRKVVVSFPLRVSLLGRLAKEIIESGRIGTVEHVQAWCNVSYSSVYFQSWYRDENETQGLFLQKATHDFDCINFLLEGNRPQTICAMTSKQVFKGMHPAGLKCMDCAERTTCHESPYHLSRSAPLPLDMPAKEMCAFAVDTGNEDSGSALIQYASGLHASYSQNFFTRNQAATRGMRFIGYHGTLEFDWYTSKLRVFPHHGSHTETHEVDKTQAHGGGDTVLAAHFTEVIRGERASMSTLEDGLLSVLMCLKAKESARTHTFQGLEFTAALAGQRAVPDALAVSARR
ncbi:MAG TPA: Gfo/Idh/MocA family oxidoreductase [Capsulimonadaceae bacterium]|nr:Gfo/Idh/MocA family oxidoreductase [Capsulimonadaceae bacterium]